MKEQYTMMRTGALLTLALLGAVLLAGAGATFAQGRPGFDPNWPVYEPPAVQMLQADLISKTPALEAGQGVAVDKSHVYAVANFAIGKYRRDDGERVAQWRGERGGLISHLNSCLIHDKDLVCAHSNHPQLPFANSIERFNPKTLEHKGSHSLGVMDEGSLVWFDETPEGWVAGLAHYNDETGLPFKDNSHASIVLYDPQWRRIGGWALPAPIIERMAPQAASGGAIGPDGLLYMMGHDRPEMYVMARPSMGPTLLHVATIAIDAAGQAFDFDESDPGSVCAINRPTREIRCFRLPKVDVDMPYARTFR